MTDVPDGTIYWFANDRFYALTHEGLTRIMTDAERESLIESYYDQMVAAPTKDEQTKHWTDMCYHVRLRSPEQIFKMEAERRISAKYAPLMTYQIGEVA